MVSNNSFKVQTLDNLNIDKMGPASYFCALRKMYAYHFIACYTQGNYATRDSSGVCHLMPQRHLQEWRKEEEWAFAHRGSRIQNNGLENTLLAIVNCIYMKSL